METIFRESPEIVFRVEGGAAEFEAQAKDELDKLIPVLKAAITEKYGWPVKTRPPNWIWQIHGIYEVDLGDGVGAYCTLIQTRSSIRLQLGATLDTVSEHGDYTVSEHDNAVSTL